jgi:GxxExxY protein
MPVHLEQPIKALCEQEFHDLDYQVMKWAFDAHNRLGRFYSEKIYQNELLTICRENGLNAETEVQIKLTHKSFTKDLFIDLLLENSSVYELKAATNINSDHRIQTIDYLLLSNTQHGKIINFRPPSVEHEFVSTSLCVADRQKFSIHHKNWNHESETSARLLEITTALLTDWGIFLDSTLYKEAICHFFGGLEKITYPVEIKRNDTSIRTQNIPLLSPMEPFCISSVKNGVQTYRSHLKRFLDCTNMSSLHWINLNRSEVTFETFH